MTPRLPPVSLLCKPSGRDTAIAEALSSPAVRRDGSGLINAFSAGNLSLTEANLENLGLYRSIRIDDEAAAYNGLPLLRASPCCSPPGPPSSGPARSLFASRSPVRSLARPTPLGRKVWSRHSLQSTR